MSEVTIALSRSYTVAHGRVFSAVTLRAPLGKDHDEIGDIQEIQINDGNPIVITHADRIIAYRKRLLKSGDGLPFDEDLSELELVDTLAIKAAIRGFFSDAQAQRSGKRKTSSSSASDGDLPTS